jgi:pumilio family protein 6
VQQLIAGDEISTSKKDLKLKAAELLSASSPALIRMVKNDAAVLMREKMSSQVVQEIMLHAVGRYLDREMKNMLMILLITLLSTFNR